MNPSLIPEKKEIFALENTLKVKDCNKSSLILKEEEVEKEAKDKDNNSIDNNNESGFNSSVNNEDLDNSKEDESNFKTGRWHPQEHKRFIKGCLLYGNNWKKVSLKK